MSRRLYEHRRARPPHERRPEALPADGISNHALSRLLARRPEPKPPLRTGKQVDAIFDTSPYLKDLVGAKLRKVSLAKIMKVDNEAAFKTAWLEYAQRSINPATDRNFSEEEAESFLATKGVRAFQDEEKGVIHIRKERADLGTQIHEGMHAHSHDRFRSRMNYAVNEGVTEYFTRKVGPEVDVHRDDSSFLREFTSATHLVTVATEPVVAAAYFEGDLDGLKNAVDAAKGGGTWGTWLGHLDASDFKAANRLLTS
ncbi:MAG TPA: hypothetical protein VFM58_24860 [Solirubrobacteraceae bacterium]|nr:hypothetical protein [Solirubrobacteraceae bacterium]